MKQRSTVMRIRSWQPNVEQGAAASDMPCAGSKPCCSASQSCVGWGSAGGDGWTNSPFCCSHGADQSPRLQLCSSSAIRAQKANAVSAAAQHSAHQKEFPRGWVPCVQVMMSTMGWCRRYSPNIHQHCLHCAGNATRGTVHWAAHAKGSSYMPIP